MNYANIIGINERRNLMNGGLIEGLKKIYTGSNAWKIHLWIFGLTLVMSIVLCYAGTQIEVPAGKHLNELMLGKYFITEEPVLGIIYLIATLLLSGYLFNTVHNMVKFFSLNLTDEEAKQYNIFPALNITEILKVLPKLIVVGLLWIFYMTVFITICILATSVIKAKLFSVLVLFASILVIIPVYSMVFTKFCENYEIKSVVNPLCAIDILKKTFIPLWWLIVRTLLFVLILAAITILFAFILAIFFRFIGEPVIEGILTVIIFYALIICYFAYYYGCANIYNKKLKNSEEELA